MRDTFKRNLYVIRNLCVILLVMIIILLIPMIINEIINLQQSITPVVANNDWIGFFGSYTGSLIGGIIGALIAIYVAKIQVNQQKENFEKDLNFRIQQQEKNLKNQLKIWEKQQLDEANRIEKEKHNSQIYILRQIEMELIKIRNTCQRLQGQAVNIVFSNPSPRYDAVSKERKTTHLIWSQIDKLVDSDITFRLQLLSEQYDEMIDILGATLWQIKDKIELLYIEIQELHHKGKKSKTDQLHIKSKNTEVEALEADLRYIILEKKHYWDVAKSGSYITQAEDARKIVRAEIIKSCKINDIEAPLDPNLVE